MKNQRNVLRRIWLSHCHPIEQVLARDLRNQIIDEIWHSLAGSLTGSLYDAVWRRR